MSIRAAGALQSVPIRYAYPSMQRLYAMVLTQGAGSCSAKHTGNLRFTAIDQRRLDTPLCLHYSIVAC